MSETGNRRQRTKGIQISLSLKLLAAFVLVILVAISVLALVSRQTTVDAFTRFVRDNQEDRAEPPEELIDRLADYYREHGNWIGVEPLLVELIASEEGQRPLAILLVDQTGEVVATNWLNFNSLQLPANALDDGWPIKVGGRDVGFILIPNRRPVPPAMRPFDHISPEGLATVERIQRAIVIAGLSAGAVALVIAGLLAWRLINPLRRLSDAADAIARGDL